MGTPPMLHPDLLPAQSVVATPTPWWWQWWLAMGRWSIPPLRWLQVLLVCAPLFFQSAVGFLAAQLQALPKPWPACYLDVATPPALDLASTLMHLSLGWYLLAFLLSPVLAIALWKQNRWRGTMLLLVVFIAAIALPLPPMADAALNWYFD